MTFAFLSTFSNWEKIVFYAMNQWFPFMTFMSGFWLAWWTRGKIK